VAETRAPFDFLPAEDCRPGVFGDNALKLLPRYLDEHRVSRILLVTGRSSFAQSGAASVSRTLAKKTDVLRWCDFSPNPSADDLLRGLTVLAEFDPDAVVGIGGGSVLDMAKLLCAFDGVRDLRELHELITSSYRPTHRRRHMVLVPTTSGSGSESTHFCVVYVGRQKFSVASPLLHPDFVILDPILSNSGSRYQKATSGIDAVTQAIESIWAVGSTSKSQFFAVEALRFLTPSLPSWVAGDCELGADVAAGSHLAGRAIDISKTTGPHALSYGITTRANVSHGHAVAMTLSAFAQMHVEARPSQLQEGLTLADFHSRLNVLSSALGLSDPTQIAGWFIEFCKSLGLSLGLSTIGITEDDDIQALAQEVNVERLSNNPVAFTQSELKTIVRQSVLKSPRQER